MRINDLGLIVQECWEDLPHHYTHVELDEFVVVPNHVHGIIILHDAVGARLRRAPTRHSLSEIVRAFKSFQRAASMNFVDLRRQRSGNVTVLTMWCATLNPFREFVNTFDQIQRCGNLI